MRMEYVVVGFVLVLVVLLVALGMLKDVVPSVLNVLQNITGAK